MRPRRPLAVELLEDRCVPAGVYATTALVSDQPGQARLTDTNLVNPWGIALGPSSDFWLANNGTNTSSLFGGDVNGRQLSADPLGVTIPGGAPTGTVFNGTADFVVHNGAQSGAAQFIYASEGGEITGWSGATGTAARPAASTPGAVYRGLAIGSTSKGNFLYASDFPGNKIDVYDKNFAPATLTGTFTDPGLPTGYAPFNIQNLGGKLYVAYAPKDATGQDEMAGPGLGLVDVFSTDGVFVRRLTTGGPLNAPWGLALAPAGFGSVGGDVLVGNFGDGRISAFNPTTGAFVETLSDANGSPVVIDGLWALQFGNGVSAGASNTLYFTAGPANETHGLFGSVKAVPTVPPAITSANAATFTAGAAGTFTVTATGSPTPSLSETGALPAGVTFTDLENGTATIAGTPDAAAVGTFPITITAHNVVGPDATQSFTLTVNAPVVPITVGPPALPDGTVGTPYSQTVTASGPPGPFTFAVTTGALPPGLTLAPDTGALTGTPTADGAFAFTVTATAGTQTATRDYILTVVLAPAMIVLDPPAATAGGVGVGFDRPPDVSQLNLIPEGAAPADVTVTDPNGNLVRGTLVVSGVGITFVPTGGWPVPGAYTLTLRSGSDGFRDGSGTPLDGDGDGTAGGDYVKTFTVADPAAVRVSVPAVVRGPGQAVDLKGAGLPVRLAPGSAQVTDVTADFVYDPALLDVTDAAAGPDGAGGAVTFTRLTPNSVRLTFHSDTPVFGTTALNPIALTATVPAGATPGMKALLQLQNVSVNGGAVAADGAAGVQIVALPGDADGKGTYTGLDAVRVARLAAGLDNDLTAFPLADPVLIAGVDENGVLRGVDAVLVARKAAGLPVTEIPDPPTGGVSAVAQDPVLSVGSASAAPGETVAIGVNLTVTDPAPVTVQAGTVVLGFDPAAVSVAGVQLDSALAGAGFALSYQVDAAAGTLTVQFLTLGAGVTLPPGSAGTALVVTLKVADAAPAGPTALNLRAGTELENAAGSLLLSPAPTDAPTDPVDGTLTVTPADVTIGATSPARNTLGDDLSALDGVFVG